VTGGAGGVVVRLSDFPHGAALVEKKPVLAPPNSKSFTLDDFVSLDMSCPLDYQDDYDYDIAIILAVVFAS
jgi:hypothetical protein